MQLDERALVQQVGDERVYVVGAALDVGQVTGERPVDNRVDVEAALVAQQRGECRRLVERGSLRLGDDMYDTRPPAVRLRAAEALHVDVLTGHRPDDLRTGDEDPPGRTEDDDVGERGPVRSAACRRPEHHRDLRDLARRTGHDREDFPDRVQRGDALGQSRPAGVPNSDDRYVIGERSLVSRHHDGAPHRTHGAAHDRGVRAERDHWRALHSSDRGEHAGVVVGAHELAGAVVEQRLEPGTRVARVLLARQLGRLAGGALVDSGHAVLRF